MHFNQFLIKEIDFSIKAFMTNIKACCKLNNICKQRGQTTYNNITLHIEIIKKSVNQMLHLMMIQDL